MPGIAVQSIDIQIRAFLLHDKHFAAQRQEVVEGVGRQLAKALPMPFTILLHVSDQAHFFLVPMLAPVMPFAPVFQFSPGRELAMIR